MAAASILVCENEALTARNIEQSLVKFGYDVVGVAPDAERALELLNSSRPDLVLMDISLNGQVNGIDLASAIWEQHGIPAIYLTASSDDETVARAKATLPLSYLLKPFDEEELKRAIELGLYRHQEQRQLVERLSEQLDSLSEGTPSNEAVQLEQDFLRSQRITTSLRIGSNVAAKLKPDADSAADLIRSLLHEKGLPEEAKQTLRRAAERQARLCETIDRLIRCSTVSRPVKKTQRVERLLEQAMLDVAETSGRDINFIESFADNEHEVAVDRSMVLSVLMQVMRNSVEASSGSPVIGVGTALVFEELPERFNAAAEPGWYVMVKIEDMGGGMPTDVSERVFEPCFSASALTQAAGMGLCEVFAVMQAHGGWVTVCSKPQVGTRIELRFPVARRRNDRKREVRTLN